MIKIEQKLSLREDTNKYSQKDIYNEILEDAKILNSLGYSEALTNSYLVSLSTRGIKNYGSCKKIGYNHYKITINENYLKTANPEDVHNTIAHEIIHSLKGCMNHGPNWKEAASKLNSNYHFTKITRLGNSKEYREAYINNQYKHKITCNECGRSWKWFRKSRIVNSCIKGTATCKCGAHSFTYESLV